MINNLITLLPETMFYLALILLWATSTPALILRNYLVEVIRYPMIQEMIQCTPCSSFWIFLLIIPVYAYVPVFFVKVIIFTGIIALINEINQRNNFL